MLKVPVRVQEAFDQVNLDLLKHHVYPEVIHEAVDCVGVISDRIRRQTGLSEDIVSFDYLRNC